MRAQFWQRLLTALSVQDAAAVAQRDYVGSIQQSAVYVVFGAGTSAGAVVVEGSHDPDYTGTWANIATINWAAANRCHMAAITGVHRAIRVRISTAIVGGTVDAYIIGN